MLEQTANQIVSALKAHQTQLKQDPKIIQQVVERYLLPHVDVTGMSRSVLGRNQWNKATGEEKQAFTRAFTQLVVRTYSTPLAQYSGETIVFAQKQETAADGHFARVNSVIHRPNGQAIPLTYALVVQQGEWKVYDLTIEGVSLLQSFRNQFSSVLQASSMHELIEQMKQRNVSAVS
jgi:phospholipid transport system substrate-binding protein